MACPMMKTIRTPRPRSHLKYLFLGWILLGCIAWHAEATYQFRVGDRLQILVMEHPDYSATMEVEPDGHITYYFGEVTAAGRSPEQLAEVIREQLTSYISQPVVAVIPRIRNDGFFVLGAVGQPGDYPLPADGEISLIQALAISGGLQAESANTSRIEILRPKEGESKIYDLSTPQVREVTIHAGDVVWVQRLGQIHVSGQVQTPGSFFIRQPVNVARALALAGGPLYDIADTSKISIYGADGSDVILDSQKENPNKYILKNGDVVYVPHAYQETKLFVLGYVHNPGSHEVKRPVTPLEAVALGGGVIEAVADLKNARLIRANGTVETLNLLDFFEGQMTEPTLLYPGDTLQVPRKRQINWSLVLSLLSVVSVTVSILRR